METPEAMSATDLAMLKGIFGRGGRLMPGQGRKLRRVLASVAVLTLTPRVPQPKLHMATGVEAPYGRETGERVHDSAIPLSAAVAPSRRVRALFRERDNVFNWRGLDLHHLNRRRPVLTLVQDSRFPHLYRIRYPNGWESTPGNLTRAKDAAYGHARYLLSDALEAA
jgi:hypothetical protein